MAQDSPMTTYPKLGEPLGVSLRSNEILWGDGKTWLRARLKSPFKLHGMWEVRDLAGVPE